MEHPDDDTGPRVLLGRAAAWIDATPAETLGLAVLLGLGLLATGLVWWVGAPRSGEPAPPRPPEVRTGEETAAKGASTEVVVVHITGAVLRPGIVTLPAGARVGDAVTAAGGPRADANLDALNLARPLADGERIAVPGLGDPVEAEASGGPVGSVGAWLPDGRLDLNRATATDLEELPGIGPVLARRIVEWREANGPFEAPGQLREVSGIGERVFQQLAPLVAV